MSVDARYMRQAIELARRGVGEVEPNPPVGALVVRDGQVVGQGYHRFFGGPHAEVEALDAAGVAARGSTLYVTLEPCSTTGKTPPCTTRVIDAGVRRVVVAEVDPNPSHAGRGLSILRERGVDVTDGVERDEAGRLLERFRRDLRRDTPLVIAKWAMTLDGKIAAATGDSRWISGEDSRRVVHTLRGRVSAVAVGVGTVEADDPSLTARPAGALVARRVVFDDALRTPATWRALQDQGPPVTIVHATGAPADRVEALRRRGAELIACDGVDRGARTRAGLVALREQRVERMLVEGGAGLLGTLFDLREVDEVMVFIAPKVAGGRDAPSPVGGRGVAKIAAALPIEGGRLERVGDDLLLRGLVV